MSDLKNVLKAGLLVTASLLATGCSNDNKEEDKPIKGDSSIGGGSDGVSKAVVKSTVPTFALDMGTITNGLKAVGLTPGELPKRPEGGYGKDYDVLANLKMEAQTALAATGTGTPPAAQQPSDPKLQPRTKALLSFVDYDQKGDSFKLDVSDTTKYKADAIHAGALIFSGLIDATRHTFNATVKGKLNTNAMILRNTVVDALGGDAASISTPYAYIGLDSAFGYPFARQDATGKEVALPVEVHSEQPYNPTDAPAKLSGGKTPTPKPITAATASKPTQTTKVTPTAANKSAAKPTVVVAPQKAAAKGVLALNMVKSNTDQKKMLDAAGLNVEKGLGALDIGGRVAVLNVSDVVISAISGVQPELELPAGVVSAPVAKTPVATKAALSAGAAQPPKKTTSTPASVAASSAATANKPTTGQALVRQDDGSHHFMFNVKAGGFYSEIGELNVGENTTYQVIAHHSLFVHTLNLNNNLAVRVLAEAHTLDKLSESNLGKFIDGANAAAKVSQGQAMMKILADEEHSVETSDVLETKSDKVSPYVHYDSHTPFSLWVADAKVAKDMKLTLGGIDLDTDVVLEEGVYALPLVKDMSGKLPNSSGKTPIAIGDGSLQVTEWKIMSNGYFDMVLLAQVGKKAASKLSSGAFNRALMSSKAQGGRSVASATLDAVVSKLDPTNLVAASFANLSSARLNQASQIASLARGVNGANAEKLGSVEQYAVTFNHAGAQFGLTYNIDGGNAFSSSKGTTSFGANVASDILGLKAIVSAEASVDAGKNAYASSSLASYNAGVTFAKAYNLGGLSVVPMGGFGVSSNALNSYSAVVPMAAGMLGLSMNDVSFTAATFHAGVNLALDDFVATATGANASLTLGVAGYLASSANATLSTSEGKSSDLQFGGDAVTPYAQFNLGFATGEKLNTMISSGIVAVNFGLDR
ncbi:MAG: hypothetical protein Q8Q56_00620 [Alphaproteobacteria bacterium]|nr:hypothetical protein [Alphaproteobacteria bacterium]